MYDGRARIGSDFGFPLQDSPRLASPLLAPHIVPAPVNESTTRAITNRLIGHSAQVRALCYLARTSLCFIRGFANFRSFRISPTSLLSSWGSGQAPGTALFGFKKGLGQLQRTRHELVAPCQRRRKFVRSNRDPLMSLLCYRSQAVHTSWHICLCTISHKSHGAGRLPDTGALCTRYVGTGQAPCWQGGAWPGSQIEAP